MRQERRLTTMAPRPQIISPFVEKVKITKKSKISSLNRHNGYPQVGRLLGWHHAWPSGWAHSVVKAGLQWGWRKNYRPPIRNVRKIPRTSASIDQRVVPQQIIRSTQT